MTPRLHDPQLGYRYSLAVHGEPPEGVEVLWGNEVDRWSTVRGGYATTRWMLAPVDAPAEEPPFPLSREEWSRSKRDVFGQMPRELWNWWLNNELAHDADYDTVVTAWRAAGCPGATTAAEEGEAREGPWRVDRNHHGELRGLWLMRGEGTGVRLDTDPDMPFHLLEDLIADANRAHELEREVERLCSEFEVAGAMLANAQLQAGDADLRLVKVLKEVQGKAFNDAGPLAADWRDHVLPAVRSLVADLRTAESERDELKKDSQQFALTADALGASWKSAPEVAADLRARLEKAEAERDAAEQRRSGLWLDVYRALGSPAMDIASPSEGGADGTNNA